MAETSELTHGQLEQSLSQLVMGLYLTQLGHQANKVSCQLVDKTLTIIVEDSITRPEQLLIKIGKQELAKQVRSVIHQAIQLHLKSLIEEVIEIPVIDILGNSAFDTARTTIIAVLAAAPEVCNSSLAQVKQDTGSEGDGDG